MNRVRATIAALLVACAWPASGRAQPQAEYVPCSFAASELTFGSRQLDTARVRCGQITVPENRRTPNARTLKLAFAVIKAEKPVAGAAPLVYLEGGPGLPALTPYFLALEGPSLAVDRDVITFDQRGTGRSEPKLCPNLSAEELAIAARDIAGVDEAAARRRALRACQDEMTRRGYTPNMFDMSSTVADLEALRRALGHQQWNILGRSYGGALVQMVLRDYPITLQSAIMVNPVPLNWSNVDEAVPSAAQTLTRIYRECAADPQCGAAFPDARGELDRVHASLRTQPWTVHVDTALVSTGSFTINAGDFMTIVDGLLYSDSDFRFLPSIVHAFAQRDTIAGSAVVQRIFGQAEQTSLAVRNSVWCYDGVTGNSKDRWMRAAAGQPDALKEIGSLYWQVCADWSSGKQTAGRRVSSNVPTLVLAGAYDHVTPANKASTILQRIRNSQQVVFPASSHVLPSSEPAATCAYRIERSFLSGPGATLDTSCIEQLPAVRYSTQLPPWITQREP